jgi:polar amino acid transport system substrate-binding protein
MKLPVGSTRRLVVGAAAVSMVAGLAACGGKTDDSPDAAPTGDGATAGAADPSVAGLVPEDVKSDGKLVVAMEAQYPPFGFHDTDNKTIIGADADMAAALAEQMGLKLEIVDTAFDSIIPSLASKRYEVGMSAFTVTAEREKQVDFVTYYYEGDGALVKVGNPDNLGVNDSLCGVKVAVLKGSTQDVTTVPELNKVCTDAGKPELDASVLPGSNDLALALQSGRVDAVLTDGSNAAYTAKQTEGKMELAEGDPYNPAPFGIASPKGNGMDKAVQAALEKLIADGTYLDILTKWGMQNGAVETAKINEVAS